MSSNGTTGATDSSSANEIAAKESTTSSIGSNASAGGDSKTASSGKSAGATATGGGKPKFTIGDLVWAKMKGFSPWPGKVVAPNETTLKKPPGNLRGKTAHVIFFFGTNNYGWIPEDAIQPYEIFKDKNSKLNKSAAMKEAIGAIEEYIRRGGALNDALDGAGADAGLPSIDDELSTIFPEKKGKDKKEDGEGLSAPLKKPVKGAQRDYSRTPFKSKSKSKSDEDSAPQPAKRARGAASKDSAEAAPSAPQPSVAASRPVIPKTTASSGAKNILARTSQYLLSQESGASGSGAKSEEGGVDLGSVSDKNKKIKASTLKFGFIGLGLMGQRLLKNLLNSGHSVTIWNRTPSKCKDFLNAGAQKATTPADVVAASDVTFCCLADPVSVKEIVFGNCGVLAEIRNNKGYVEMTNIDPETANDVSEAIIARGGRYLEAPIVSAGKAAAEAGNLTVIAAGDKQLFDDCQSCIEAISNHAFYLGSQVGDATKMNLALSMLTGNLIGSLAESMALADRTGLQQKDLLEILSVSPLNCAMLIAKGKAMIEGGFATEMPLTHMQKDLRLALGLGETYEHPLPITASTNEVFKHAKHLGYSEHDVAAVYIRSRF